MGDDEAAGKGEADSGAMQRYAALKADGEATVVRRTIHASAYAMASLKVCGLEAITRRAEMNAAYKVAVLKLQGLETIARRTRMIAALEAALESAQPLRDLLTDSSKEAPSSSASFSYGTDVQRVPIKAEKAGMITTTVVQATTANTFVEEAAKRAPAQLSSSATELDATVSPSWSSVPNPALARVASQAVSKSRMQASRRSAMIRRALTLTAVVVAAARVAGLPIRLLP
mmetsp:Transcript_53328/g.137924  ORF Transcript_53328/g.137924 Transcript_53328/m.137924 type:complete len:230 (+) Transcript_53328:37-726(+)